MTMIEIILLLVGCVFMIGSFFISEKLSSSELNKIAELSEDELKIFKEYCRIKGVENTFLNYIIWKDNIALNKLKAKYFARNDGEQ